MMVSPEGFVTEYKGKSYEELIVVRDDIIEKIKAFEEGTIPKEEYHMNPSQSIQYSYNLQYLAGVCKLLQEAFEKETVEDDEEIVFEDGVDYAEEMKRQTGEDLEADRTIKLIF